MFGPLPVWRGADQALDADEGDDDTSNVITHSREVEIQEGDCVQRNSTWRFGPKECLLGGGKGGGMRSLR